MLVDYWYIAVFEINVILTLILAYFAVKRLDFYGKLENAIVNGGITLLENIETDEGLQKNVYMVGAIIGNGIAAGSGMNTKATGGGKFTLNKFLAELAGNWIQSKVMQPQTTSTITQPVTEGFFNPKR